MPFLAGVSVEDVSAVVTIMSLKRDSRLIAHKLESGWFVGVVRSVETKASRWSVCSQVQVLKRPGFLRNTSTCIQAEPVSGQQNSGWNSDDTENRRF